MHGVIAAQCHDVIHDEIRIILPCLDHQMDKQRSTRRNAVLQTVAPLSQQHYFFLSLKNDCIYSSS